MKNRLFLLLLCASLTVAAQDSQKKAPVYWNDSASLRRLPSVVVPHDTLHHPMPVKKLDTATDDRMPVVRPPKNQQPK